MTMTQTIESKGARMIPTARFFLDRLWVWITGIAFWIIGAAFLAIFTPYWETVVAIWRSPMQIAAVQKELTARRGDLSKATGDNRVIRQPPGLSYVTEPVYVGDPVVLNLVIKRTPFGAKCHLTFAQSLFAEAGGVVTPGSELKPVRQINEDETRLRVTLTPPANLRPARMAPTRPAWRSASLPTRRNSPPLMRATPRTPRARPVGAGRRSWDSTMLTRVTIRRDPWSGPWPRPRASSCAPSSG